jgi:hypothetical protein
MDLPVAGHLDAGEVDETAAGHLRRLKYALAFVGGEPSDRTGHCTGLPGRRGVRYEELSAHGG